MFIADFDIPKQTECHDLNGIFVFDGSFNHQIRLFKQYSLLY